MSNAVGQHGPDGRGAKAGSVRPAPPERLASARRHHAAGRLLEAKAIYERILRRHPRHGECLYLLGVLRGQQGRPDLAVALFERAIAENPSFPMGYAHLGEAYRLLGRFDDAIAACRRGLRIAPVLAETLNTLGAALAAQGKTDEALEPLRRAAAARPDLAAAHANLGNVHRERGDLDAATEAYARALELVPHFVNAYIGLGATRRAQGRLEKAVACLREAVRLAPNEPMGWSNLGVALTDFAKPDEAERSFREAIRLAPNFASGHANLGTFYRSERRLDEAVASYREGLRRDPDHREALAGMAQILSVQGRFDEAERYWQRVLAIDPACESAHAGLALARKFAPEDEDIGRLETLLRREKLARTARSGMHFALGKMYDDAGEFDKAFHHFEAGNTVKDVGAGFDAEAFSGDVDRQIATFDRPFFDSRASWGCDSECPVLIVGMPRSGTSLVEQILASHPCIFGAGELKFLHEITNSLPERLGTETPFPKCSDRIDESTARDIADGYLARLRAVSPDADRVIDKMPGNLQRLGLVALLFPRARVIHCRRDPLDTCLSCYFQDFKSPHPYASDLENLGAYHRQCDRLMAHWRDVLPLPMLEVWYEDLVADQDAMSRKLVEFCGIAWDDACLEFHANDRPVWTASSWQVRQPIYKTSVERWRHYDAHLGPLRKGLGEPVVGGGC